MPKYYDEKAKERSMRYMKDKRDKLTLNLPAGAKDRYREHAENVRGKSLTGLIVDLLDADIKAAGQVTSDQNNEKEGWN